MKPTRLLDQATTPDGTPLTLHEHDGLDGELGLEEARAALGSHGRIAVWSAGADPRFAARLQTGGFDVEFVKARTHPAGGSWNTAVLGPQS